MSIKIRLARAGSKKRPFYRVVAADSRMPRDGRFIEKLGTYNPLLNKEDNNRVNLDLDRIKDWLSKGAQTTDRISRLLENLEVLPKKVRNNPIKAKPKNIYSNSDDIGEDFKSVTFSIVFQHSSKTLEDSDVNPIIDEIVNFAEKKFNAKLRV